jgi:SAM-dependent methyltransferase
VKKNLEILDAGCGTGINLDYLAEFGNVTGADISEDAIEFCRKRGKSSVLRMDLTSLALPGDRFDLVTVLDVIEHIEDDEAALREAVRVTKPGGSILVTVPAFPELWSEHDEINHHRRRYRAQRIKDLFRMAECDLIRFTHMNTLLFPVAYAVRTWQQARRRWADSPKHPPRTDFVDYHPVINGLLAAIFTSEIPWVTTTGLPFGLSLLCFARKRAGNAASGVR